MEITKTNSVSIGYNIDDLRAAIQKSLGLEDNGVQNFRIEPIYRTEVTQGYDPHDADYNQVFDGLRVTYNEV